jgi:hypothetical protein
LSEEVRVALIMARPTAIFVFGSNAAGRHGKGAALTAARQFGATYGVGFGPTGRTFAIPTKDEHLRTYPVSKIASYVDSFLEYARQHPDIEFAVTRIGCGLAGHADHEMAPLFRDAPMNCHLPTGWRSPEDPLRPASLPITHDRAGELTGGEQAPPRRICAWCRLSPSACEYFELPRCELVDMPDNQAQEGGP